MNTATPNLSMPVLHNEEVDTAATTQTVVNVANISAAQTTQPNQNIVLAKNVVFKTINATAANPAVTNDSSRIEIKNEDVQSSLQLRTDDNKKIIISGAKSMNDVPTILLQQILTNVKNVKSNQTILVLNNKKETNIQNTNIQNTEIKSYESIVNEVLQNDLPQDKDTDKETAPCKIIPENKKSFAIVVAPCDFMKNDTIVARKDVPKATETNNLPNTICHEPKQIDKSDAKDLRSDESQKNSSKKVVRINQQNVYDTDHKYVRNDTINNYTKNVNNNNQIVKSSAESLRTNETIKNTPDKAGNVENNREKNHQDKGSKVEQFKKPILAVAPRKAPVKFSQKQKKILYRLKSKNGTVLRYVSDKPVILKKPVICLDKMTQADAERLSKQFAKEKKNKLRKSSRLSKPNVNSDKKVDTDEKADSTSQRDYGVQTRKRKIKFLPDGRIMKDKKSKKSDSGSSLSSLDDDFDKPALTSDEDYHEDVDLPIMSSDDDSDVKAVSFKSINSKKLTPPKKVLPEMSRPTNNKAVTNTSSKTLCKQNNNSKTSTSSIPFQPPTIVNARPVQNKVTVDAHTIFSTLLKVPIYPHQLNVRRFKPKIQNAASNSNNSFIFKKIFSPDLKQLIPLLKTSPTKNASFSNPSVQKKVFAGGIHIPANIKPATLLQNTIWSHSNISKKTEYKAVSLDPPPLAPLSNRESPASRNINTNIFKTPASTNRLLNHSPINITSKFDGFTNTKVVKTKDGPKKAIIAELKKREEPITVYDIMEEIFESMPHWNIHVIPENKSFCLAQISLGRTGIPVLKKSIEINSEFSAKVYVHQLHCKRYDGIYDTESKIKKLIHDVDSVAV